jgi:hypothetical protein
MVGFYLSADYECSPLNSYLKAIQDPIFHVIQSYVTSKVETVSLNDQRINQQNLVKFEVLINSTNIIDFLDMMACSVASLNLIDEAAGSSETSVPIYQITRCHISGDSTHNNILHFH